MWYFVRLILLKKDSVRCSMRMYLLLVKWVVNRSLGRALSACIVRWTRILYRFSSGIRGRRDDHWTSGVNGEEDFCSVRWRYGRHCLTWHCLIRAGSIPCITFFQVFLKEELRKNARLVSQLELLPQHYSADWSRLFLQTFDGNITVTPPTLKFW